MSLLVRKISPSKWVDETKSFFNKDCLREDMPGDIISDLKTSNNTLSLWRVESANENDLNEAVIAITTGRDAKTIETTHIIWLDEQQLIDNGFDINPSSGDTAIDDLIETHRDVCNLTYSSLSSISKIFLDAIHNEQYKQVGKQDVKKNLKNALSKERINKNKCTNELLAELGTLKENNSNSKVKLKKGDKIAKIAKIEKKETETEYIVDVEEKVDYRTEKVFISDIKSIFPHKELKIRSEI